MANSIMENVKADIVYVNADPGTTETISTLFVDMRKYSRVAFLYAPRLAVAGDTFTIFKIIQATDSAGTGAKVLTGNAGVLYDNALGTYPGTATGTSNTQVVQSGLLPDTVTNNLIVEVDAIAMDFANSFFFAGLDFKMGTNSGTEAVNIICLRTPIYHTITLNVGDSSQAAK